MLSNQRSNGVGQRCSTNTTPVSTAINGRTVLKDCSGDADLARSLHVTEEECSADAGIAASLQKQELPCDDCSNDELIARQLAGMNIESPESASASASSVAQGGRTKVARKNHARHERRRQQRAEEETQHTNWRTNARNNHANNIERLLNKSTAHLTPRSLAAHELELMQSLRMHAGLEDPRTLCTTLQEHLFR